MPKTDKIETKELSLGIKRAKINFNKGEKKIRTQSENPYAILNPEDELMSPLPPSNDFPLKVQEKPVKSRRESKKKVKESKPLTLKL